MNRSGVRFYVLRTRRLRLLASVDKDLGGQHASPAGIFCKVPFAYPRRQPSVGKSDSSVENEPLVLISLKAFTRPWMTATQAGTAKAAPEGAAGF